MSEQFNEHTASSEALTFRGRVLPELPADYTEPSIHNALIVPYGAMPANPYRDELTKAQQRDIEAEFYKLYATPPKDMPASFVELVLDDYVIHEQRRRMENYEGYMNYVAHEQIVDDELIPKIELFERGQASVDQILDVATQTSVHHLELGKVTHPFGYRMHHLDVFRSDVQDAVESHGGVVYPSISPYRSIGILPKVERVDDGSEHGIQKIVGFVVKYKRDFGHVAAPGKGEVVHLVERQIAAYRVDEASGFDHNILAAMQEYSDKYPKRMQWDQVLHPSFHDHIERTGCKDFIEKAVQTDSLEDFVVPISTTIYGYKQSPVTSKAVGTTAVRPQYDNGNLAYFGPAFKDDAVLDPLFFKNK